MGVVTAAAVAGAATIGAAAISSSAAGDAADAQLSAEEKARRSQERTAQQSEAFLREQSGIAREDLAPYRQAQAQALGQLQGFSDENNPIYQQQRQFQTQQIQQQLAAQGLLRSKNQTDLLQNLELGLSQQRLGVISGLSNLGAAQQSASISQNLGLGLANSQQALGAALGSSFARAGQAQAQGALGQGQAIGGGLVGLGNIAQGAYGNYQAQQQQDKLFALLGGGGIAGGGSGGGSSGYGGSPSLGVNTNLGSFPVNLYNTR